jgi:hypothetical protein
MSTVTPANPGVIVKVISKEFPCDQNVRFGARSVPKLAIPNQTESAGEITTRASPKTRNWVRGFILPPQFIVTIYHTNYLLNGIDVTVDTTDGTSGSYFIGKRAIQFITKDGGRNYSGGCSHAGSGKCVPACRALNLG